MSAVTVDVSSKILNWIIPLVQADSADDDVLEALHVWASGEKKPTLRQLEEVSRKTHIPFGYFFLSSPPNEDFYFAEYRTIGSDGVSNPSRNLIDTIDTMRDIQEWMTEYKQKNDIEHPSFIGKFSVNTPVETIIQSIRDTLTIEIDWFSNFYNSKETFKYFRHKLEECGVLVMQNGVVGNNNTRKLNINEFRAFCINDKMTPLIFINSNDSDAGKIFSLIHETAHIWIGEEDFFNKNEYSFSKGQETRCNYIASEILVPKELFCLKWNDLSASIEDKIQNLAKFFKCSSYVIARRAADMEFISHSLYLKFVNQYQQYIKSKPTPISGKGGSYYNTQRSRWSRPFILALAQSTRAGKTLYRDAYRLTGTKSKSFHNLVALVEGV